jgi:hypothetical protein
MSGSAVKAANRLSEAQETRATAMFADGASTRDVARAIGVGNSTASRLRQRLVAAGQLGGQAADPVTSDTETAAEADVAPDEIPNDDTRRRERDARLAELREQRSALDETARTHDARAEAARQDMARIERERLDALAAGQDATTFRAPYRQVQDDANDFATAAGLVREQITGLDAEITALQRERELEAAEAARLAARAEAARLAALAPGSVRDAFRRVREAAADVVAMAEALKAASGVAGEQVFPELTAKQSGRDPWFDSIMVLWRTAESGDVRGTLKAIVASGDWQERDVAALKAERVAREAQIRDMQAAGPARQQVPPNWPPNRGAPMPEKHQVIANEHLDQYGRTDGPPAGTLTPLGRLLGDPIHPNNQS